MPGRKADHRPQHRQPAAVGQFLHEHPAPEQFLATAVRTVLLDPVWDLRDNVSTYDDN